MDDETQYLYACLDPECPVVTFVDRVMNRPNVDPARVGTCPSDTHVYGGSNPIALIKKDY